MPLCGPPSDQLKLGWAQSIGSAEARCGKKWIRRVPPWIVNLSLKARMPELPKTTFKAMFLLDSRPKYFAVTNLWSGQILKVFEHFHKFQRQNTKVPFTMPHRFISKDEDKSRYSLKKWCILPRKIFTAFNCFHVTADFNLI